MGRAKNTYKYIKRQRRKQLKPQLNCTLFTTKIKTRAREEKGETGIERSQRRLVFVKTNKQTNTQTKQQSVNKA